MRCTVHILRYRWRSLRRWLGAHVFQLLFLGPMIVGGGLWVLDRLLRHARELLPGGLPKGAELVLALVLTATFLPAAARELYDRRGGGLLDPLPVPEGARFDAACVALGARTLPVCGVLLLAASALAPVPVAAGRLLGWGLRLEAALVALALVQVAATVVIVRLRLLTTPRLLACGGVLMLAALAAPAAARPLLLPWLAPAAQLGAVLGAAAGGEAPAAGLLPLALTMVASYLVGRWLYRRWHRADLEAFEHLTRPGRAWTPRWPRRWHRRPRPLAAQVRRDLLLVLRRFSPAVHLAVALALLFQAAALAAAAGLDAGSPWRDRVAVTGGTLSVLALVALVPFLLRHQLPRLWLERATGVALELVWQAKLWLAGILALPPFLIGVAVLHAVSGGGPAATWASVAQLAAASWIVASILGLAVFEIAEQPLLGLAFSSLVALALAALIVFYPAAWWLWLAFYAYLAGQIAGRATRRVRMTELGI